MSTVTTSTRISRFKNFKNMVRSFKRNRGAVVGFYIIAFYVLLAIFAPLISPYEPNIQDLDRTLQHVFSRGHILGTDDLGRDILSRTIYGARISMSVGLISVAIALVLGILFGLISGYYGGWVDRIFMRVTDIFLAFPFILLNIVIVSILGPSLVNAMIAIGISNVPNYVRIVRASVLAEKKEDYVMAAKSVGASDWYIIFFSILPNSLTTIFVQATMGIGTAILSAAALSFLGIGAQPPTPEWGLMIANGKDFISSAWWLITVPGLAVLSVVVGFNLFADGVRDVMDPRLKE